VRHAEEREEGWGREAKADPPETTQHEHNNSLFLLLLLLLLLLLHHLPSPKAYPASLPPSPQVLIALLALLPLGFRDDGHASGGGGVGGGDGRGVGRSGRVPHVSGACAAALAIRRRRRSVLLLLVLLLLHVSALGGRV